MKSAVTPAPSLLEKYLKLSGTAASQSLRRGYDTDYYPGEFL
jgi:hypothetical protein